jgi:hypothetical protein
MAYTITYDFAEKFALDMARNLTAVVADVALDKADCYFPMVNEAHILQYIPTDNEIKKVLEVCPNVSVVYLEDLDTCALTLNACGMDLSYELEAAYYIIDNVSPIQATWIPTTSKAYEVISQYRKIEKIA